jgi:hypothetical protein
VRPVARWTAACALWSAFRNVQSWDRGISVRLSCAGVTKTSTHLCVHSRGSWICVCQVRIRLKRDSRCCQKRAPGRGIEIAPAHSMQQVLTWITNDEPRFSLLSATQEGAVVRPHPITNAGGHLPVADVRGSICQGMSPSAVLAWKSRLASCVVETRRVGTIAGMPIVASATGRALVSATCAEAGSSDHRGDGKTRQKVGTI